MKGFCKLTMVFLCWCVCRQCDLGIPFIRQCLELFHPTCSHTFVVACQGAMGSLEINQCLSALSTL